jgi:uncharacterized Zn-binding protein involved in type VI secretion
VGESGGCQIRVPQPIASPDRVVLGGVRGVAERNLSSGVYHQDHDNSRSTRGQLRTGPRWFERSPHALTNDLSFSPQDTRTSIEQTSQGLETVPWIDDTDRQMMTRVNQSPSPYYNGPHDVISQPAVQYGDDREQCSNIVSRAGIGLPELSSSLPPCVPVPVQPQYSSYPIYDAGPTRQVITMGPPVTLGPVLERSNITMIGVADPMSGPVRSPPPRHNQRMDLSPGEDHVPVRNRVAAIEGGACSCAGACSPCWFNTTGACSNKKAARKESAGQMLLRHPRPLARTWAKVEAPQMTLFR